jgi:hypothetical protein
MTAPRVLVAMPTRGYAYAPSLLTAADLARRFGRELVVEIGRPIELVRTRLVSRFLESDADYLVTVDDDIIAPAEAIDRLVALSAPVATAPCPIVTGERIMWNVKALDSEDWMAVLPGDVFPVRHTGLGFVVIRRDVFTAIRTPWFQFGAAAGGRQRVRRRARVGAGPVQRPGRHCRRCRRRAVFLHQDRRHPSRRDRAGRRIVTSAIRQGPISCRVRRTRS